MCGGASPLTSFLVLFACHPFFFFFPFVQAGCALAVGPYSLFTLRFVAGLCMGGADLVGLVSFFPFIV